MREVNIGWTPEGEIKSLRAQNTKAWRQLIEELEKRQAAERKANFCFGFALSGWAFALFQFIRSWM